MPWSNFRAWCEPEGHGLQRARKSHAGRALPGFYERVIASVPSSLLKRLLIAWVLTGLYMLGAGLLALGLIGLGNSGRPAVVQTDEMFQELVQKLPVSLSALYYICWGSMAYNVIVGPLFFFLTRVGYYLMIIPYYINLFFCGLADPRADLSHVHS